MSQDRRYLEDFEACRIPAGQFHHRDHVRVAWLMLKESPIEEALGRFTRGIRRLAEHFGATGLYHQTITWTYLFVINERMGRLAADHDWATFRDANPDLFADAGALLRARYTPSRLSSALARGQFLLPDRAAAAGPPQGAATT